VYIHWKRVAAAFSLTKKNYIPHLHFLNKLVLAGYKFTN
jgi:hypothetical protein